MIKKSKNKKGFTLVELIVVMAILAILAAILIPSVGGMIERSNQAVDDATGRNLYMAGTMALAQNQNLAYDDDLKANDDVLAFMGTFPTEGKTGGIFALTVNASGTKAPVVTITKDGIARTFTLSDGGFDWSASGGTAVPTPTPGSPD